MNETAFVECLLHVRGNCVTIAIIPLIGNIYLMKNLQNITAFFRKKREIPCDGDKSARKSVRGPIMSVL